MGLQTEASVGAMMPITQPDQVFRKTESAEIDEAFNALNMNITKPKEESVFSNSEKSEKLMDSDSPEERRKAVLDPVDPNTEDPTKMDYDEAEVFSNIGKAENLMDSNSPEERRKAVLDPVDPNTEDPTEMDFDEEFNDLCRMCGLMLTEDDKRIDGDRSSYFTFEDADIENLFTEDAHIDKDILGVIKTLNAKGYKTIASCSGHPSAIRKGDVYKDGVMYDKLYSGARVVFEKNYDIGAAPEGWKKKVMENGKKVGIYVNPPHVNYAKGMRIDQYKKWKAKYMESLRTWASNLPKQGEKRSKKVVTEDALDAFLEELSIDLL